MELRQIDLDNDHLRDNTQNASKQIQKMNIILGKNTLKSQIFIVQNKFKLKIKILMSVNQTRKSSISKWKFSNRLYPQCKKE